MHADEATEQIEAAHGAGGGKPLAAYVAGLAMLLALATLGGGNAAKDMTAENVKASDSWSFYQAKSVRQTQYKLAADALEIELQLHDELHDYQRKAYLEKIAAYRAAIERYESEPQTGEGKKELMARAKEHEEARDLAARRDPWFDIAEVSLQIAIVLASVSAIIEWPLLLWASVAVASVGAVTTLNGYILII